MKLAPDQRAIALIQQGSYQQAKELLLSLVAAEPNNPSHHAHLAATNHALGELQAAYKCAERAKQLAPSDPEVLYNFAVLSDAAGKQGDALQAYQAAVNIKPAYAMAWYNMGGIHNRQANPQLAIDCYRKALESDPRYLKAILSLATLEKKQGNLDAAEQLLRQAVADFPSDPKPARRLGLVLFDKDQLDEANHWVDLAIQKAPTDPDNWHSSAGMKFVQGDFAEARRRFDEALAIKPDHEDSRMGKALLELSEGNLQAGWDGYEVRLKKNPVFTQLSGKPRWTGQSLEGKTLLVWGEQGLGDTIQFIRYLERLKATGGRIVTLVPKPLVPLLVQSGYSDIHNGTHEAPPYDYQIPLLSLPTVFNDSIDTLPAPIPYLNATAELSEKWRKRLDSFDGLKIGIHWQGNPSYNRDRYRSMPLLAFKPIAQCPGAHLFSLQKNHGVEQLQAISNEFKVHDFGSTLDEQTPAFFETAALIQNLDLVITSDSAVAHLAGALGAPVWLATGFSPDWRWFHGRTDSPWYPTMRLFRQPAMGEWNSVFESMAKELSRFHSEPALQRHRATTVPLKLEFSEKSEEALPQPWHRQFQQATQLHQAGDRDGAESIYRKLLATEPTRAEINHGLGVLLFEKGQYAEAVRCFRSAIENDPSNALYHRNIGPAIQLSGGDTNEAIALMQRSIELEPFDAEAHFNLAGLLNAKADFAAAEAEYRETLRLNPKHQLAWINLGQVLEKQSKQSDAIKAFQRALAADSSNLNAGRSLAKLLSAQENHVEAVRVWRRMALHHAKNASVCSGLGEALDAWYRAPFFDTPQADEADDTTSSHTEKLNTERQDILIQAILAYREATRLAPENAVLWGKLGAALSNASHTAEALKCFEKALKLRPKFPQVSVAYAQSLNNEHKFETAVKHCEKSLKDLPNEPSLWRILAASRRGMGDIVNAEVAARKGLQLAPHDWEGRAELMYIASHQGKWQEAIEIGRQLVTEKPGDIRAQLELTLQSLRYGDLPQGWKDYECRRRLGKWRNCVPGGSVSSHVDWTGQPLNGKTLLIYHEQGIGDTIQFVRYLNRLKGLDGQVIVQVHPPLVELLRQSGYENVISRDMPLPDFDFALPLMSLPFVYGDNLETIPKDFPYLSAKPELIDYWAKFLQEDGGYHIGIHWQGSPHFKADVYRSFPLLCYEPIAKLPNVKLFSLQKNHGVDQIARLGGRFEVIDRSFELDERNGAFQDTAALAKSLDLIITSDSAVAHLAGAVGAEVWLIVPIGCDWRWGHEGSDCPWYPSMRLYRQERVGEWNSVFEKIRTDLAPRLPTAS